MTLQFLTAQTDQDARLGRRLGQQPVRPRARHEPQRARRVQPGDPAHGRRRSHSSGSAAPTTGIRRSVTRNGRWQVNEFQKRLMNPANVFNNAVCNPARCGTRADAVDDRQPGQHALRSGHVGLASEPTPASRELGGAAGHRRRRVADLPAGLLRRRSAARSTRCRARVRTVRRCSARRRSTDRQARPDGRRAPARSERLLGEHGPIAGVTAPKPLDPTQFHVGDPFIGSGHPSIQNTPFEFDKLTSRLRAAEAVQRQHHGLLQLLGRLQLGRRVGADDRHDAHAASRSSRRR